MRRCFLIGWLAVTQAGCASGQLTVSLAPPFLSTGPTPASVLWMEPFDLLNPEQWRTVEVKGQTQYEVVSLDDRSCLRADSHGGASILLHLIRYDADEHEWLSWHWRVDRLVDGEDLARKDGSDAAARVYVYFNSRGLPWQKRNIDYVWSRSLPVGMILSSAYSSDSKIIVVESGAGALGQWRTVLRNVEEDYARCFDGRRPDVAAIGLMSDTDNTNGQALAYFDNIMISRSSSVHPPTAAASGEPAGLADRGPMEVSQ